MKKSEFSVYRSRWYVLAVFSLFSFIQCAAWGIYGPISQSVESLYGTMLTRTAHFLLVQLTCGLKGLMMLSLQCV
jgi:hypothetical protein